MILEMATDQHRVLNIRRTLDFILWKMGSCWSVARAKIFKAVWLSLLFLKMLQFSISFRIKFKWFILAHNVFIVRPQPIYLASSASFPHGPFTLAKLDYVQFPGQVMMIHVLVSVFLHTVYPVRKPSPSAHRVIGSVLEGPLCALRVPCALFSHHSLPWPLCTQAMESWNMLRSFNQL